MLGKPESDKQSRASAVPSRLTPQRAQASGLGATPGWDPAAAFGPEAGHGTGGLSVAPSHLTGGGIAAHSPPGLEAEESAHSVGNHHDTRKELEDEEDTKAESVCSVARGGGGGSDRYERQTASLRQADSKTWSSTPTPHPPLTRTSCSGTHANSN